ncbi:hypothetical protein BN946_scf184804.g8 [Trametes cinnabarina]|uniref:Thioredoxin domain-containing protein n=1 Tax=Pycnoporus cinnabarinus TaxID=5643 RepID=A0A060S9I9_PYCCI|nr:hypothetical protein BN946_scf184804.g8 [Trametes cinnabarina]
MASFGPETSAELAVKADFQTNIWAVFQELYEDKWDQARFRAAHDPAIVQRFWARAKLPAWDALEAQFRKGPPPFLRPGWRSPLLGKRVDLQWLDKGPFEHVKGSIDGWRDAKILIIEFWATVCMTSIDDYSRTADRSSAILNQRFSGCAVHFLLLRGFQLVRPCLAVFRDLSALARTRSDIKIITFNSEGIFTNAPIDVAAVKRFVSRRDDMDYPVYIDTQRVAVNLIPGAKERAD